MKQVYELKEGDVIRFPYGTTYNLILVDVVEIEKYNTWTRIKVKEHNGVRTLWTWLNTNGNVEVIPNDKG